MRTFASVMLAGAAAAQPLPLAVDGSADIDWSYVVSSESNDWINDIVMLTNGNLLGVGFVNRQNTTPPSDWAAVAVELTPDGNPVAPSSQWSASVRASATASFCFWVGVGSGEPASAFATPRRRCTNDGKVKNGASTPMR